MAEKGSKFAEIKGVSKGDITELKSLAKPPVLVSVVLSATALLLGMPEEQAKDWRYIKRLLGRADFLKQLCNIDISGIPAEAALKAKERSKDIEGDAVKKVSMACYGLQTWNQSVISAVLNNDDEQKTS